MMKRAFFSLLLLLGICSASTVRDSHASEVVDLESLLDEMVDRDALPKLAEPSYTLHQASSYDRASVAPDQPGWYGNDDGGGIIRSEVNDGRTEQVMLDVSGPGAIVRFWSTYLTWEFGDGVLRFYFDGAESPQIEGKFSDIIQGKHLVDGNLAQATGGFMEKNHILAGRNLYLPLPYSSGCKITYEGKDKPFYFAINYRKYTEGTKVKTFAMSQLRRQRAKLAKVQRELVENAETPGDVESVEADAQTIAAGESIELSVDGAQAIRQLKLRIKADDHRQALRSTVMAIEFDGQQTVWAPVGDFFGTGYRLSPYEGRYSQVTLDGDMLARWVMPFRQNAKVTLFNHGKQPIALQELSVHHSPWSWDERSLYFHASWTQYAQAPSARGRDTNYVTLKGRGKYVGDSLTLFNATAGNEGQPWWGEGDEKIYVDGETFPSNFGTGTEDYYGYAWVGSATFSQPFLAQPIAQGNRGRGLTVNNRWRVLDAMPFNKSLKLDVEIWHWVGGVTVDYAPTTYWYGDLTTRPVVDLDAAGSQARANNVEEVQRAVRFVDRYEVEGLLNGADVPAASVVHTMPYNQGLSNRSYCLLKPLTVGVQTQLGFYAGKEATGTLKLACVRSPQSMVADLYLNDKLLQKDVDFYDKEVSLFQLSVPNVTFRQGVNYLQISPKPANSNAPKANEVGIDYLQLLSE